MSTDSFVRRVPRLFASLLAVLAISTACEDDGGDDWDYGTNDPNHIVALGDSITEGGYPSHLAALSGLRVDDDGHAGYLSSEGIGVARSALARQPGTALILYGANDCIHGISEETTTANLRTIVQMAKGQMTKPIIANVMPMITEHEAFNSRVDRLNVLIETMASEEGVTLVDLNSLFDAHHEYFVSDGLHTTAEGDAAIAQAFNDAL